MIEDFYKKCVVIDLETTHVKTDVAEIVEIAYGTRDDGEWNIKSKMYKPHEPIPPEASAINHISNRMVENEPFFEDACQTFYDDLSPFDSPIYLVAHNSKFEENVFGAYGIPQRIGKEVVWICTYELSKRVFRDLSEKMRYSLSYLRYRLDLDIDDNVIAHRASADVEVTAKLLERLVSELISSGSIDLESDLGPQMANILNEPVIYKKIAFGKHKDTDLVDIPTDYLIWALQNVDVLKEGNERYDPNLLYSIGLVLEQRGAL